MYVIGPIVGTPPRAQLPPVGRRPPRGPRGPACTAAVAGQGHVFHYVLKFLTTAGPQRSALHVGAPPRCRSRPKASIKQMFTSRARGLGRVAVTLRRRRVIQKDPSAGTSPTDIDRALPLAHRHARGIPWRPVA